MQGRRTALGKAVNAVSSRSSHKHQALAPEILIVIRTIIGLANGQC